MRKLVKISVAILSATWIGMSLQGCDFDISGTKHLSGVYVGGVDTGDTAGFRISFEGNTTLKVRRLSWPADRPSFIMIYTISDKEIVWQGKVVGEIQSPSKIDFFPGGAHALLIKQ
ncbi:hypothetical protein [Verrucomicrobium sp. GAS474]|uniref:hypothetical protein n=1 Tax=Verrucomicrobium sp. GAS474 TaxID=1882831 RepID=UPI000B861AAF|nr:hypothetical protein [Verrucomicrobium sp. GAS474]